jgi:hypothetical protein
LAVAVSKNRAQTSSRQQFERNHKMIANQYVQTRSTDYLRLLQDLLETPKVLGIRDLGYCKLHVHTCEVTAEAQTHTFASPVEAHAFILQKFW